MGEIYDFIIERYGGDLLIYTHENNYYLTNSNIEEFFLPLDEWRELQINKILNG
jgi:hypothetical protein